MVSIRASLSAGFVGRRPESRSGAFLDHSEPQERALKRRLEHFGADGGAIRHEVTPDYSDPKVREAADVRLGRPAESEEY